MISVIQVAKERHILGRQQFLPSLQTGGGSAGGEDSHRSLRLDLSLAAEHVLRKKL